MKEPKPPNIPSLHPYLSFTDSTSLLHSRLFCLLHPQAGQRDVEWGLWSVHNRSFLLLFPPHALLLLQRETFP